MGWIVPALLAALVASVLVMRHRVDGDGRQDVNRYPNALAAAIGVAVIAVVIAEAREVMPRAVAEVACPPVHAAPGA